jgi:photosystem II stability/assembly factor-like uncharacterized protein
VSGHQGTWARTTDGGATWTAAVVPGADSLQFRDLHAVDARTAYLMSAGEGERSRIYKTIDAGRSWTLQFLNREPKAFFDCLAFWDAERGVAVSDAVDGRFLVIRTEDGGAHWEPVPADAIPPASPGEGGFAASGTCVVAGPGGRAWFGTGNGGTVARVLRTADYGRTWSAAQTPLPAGEGEGITTVAFRDALHGAALGGKLGSDAPRDEVALTNDGGRTWVLGGRPRLRGPVYGAVFVPDARAPTLVAVGPGGADLSADGGRSWQALDTLAYWSVGFASPRAGWAVGPGGRITRLSVPR